ncbi:shikimate dehydrogenase [Flexibacterium corallicola]|uniref:shikimate dehydrogenase n=1 Tax=Flexibacterium corallicola TaxID=3037259 RepID=UPI00286F8467|nr:shikimate dehydrogenase [Pseudovibrio sp. M1P-2-3]
MKIAAVTGHPVKHSRSPLIHNHWLKTYGLEGTYEKRDVPPDEAAYFFKSLKENGLVGVNVTIPNKEKALECAEVVDEAAKAIGAVNTLWLDPDGKLCGSNTDGIGFVSNLDQNAPGWDKNHQKAVVLGAGGASRAIVWALLQRGFTEVHILNRTLEKSQSLRDHFGSRVLVEHWDNRSKILDNCNLLVNTTSLGMEGQNALEINLQNLPTDAVVTDIVYTPLMTDLLVRARERGNTVVDGLGMLLHQAVSGFEKWFGITPTVTDELRQIILKDMGRM